MRSLSLRTPLVKKLICIVFCFSLIAPIFFAYFAFHHKTNAIRQEVAEHIEEGVEKSELVLLKFTHEETETLLRWEHSREFEYNHQMYDIVETEVSEDSVFYLVYWDVEETELKKSYGDILANALGIKKNSTKQRTQLNVEFRSIYFLENEEGLSLPAEEGKIVFSKVNYNLLSPSYPPPSPPPKFG